MSELVGTARVELTLDSSTFVAGVERSKNAAHGLGAEAEAAFSGLEGRAKRAATSIVQYALNIGKTREEVQALNAAQRGVPEVLWQAAINKINEYNLAQKQAADLARETAAAQKYMLDTSLSSQKMAETERLREQERVVGVLTQRFHELEAAERDAAALAAAGTLQAQTNHLREQERVVAVLTQRFHELEAAERDAMALAQAGAAQQQANQLREQERVVGVLTQRFHELEAAEKQLEDFALARAKVDENNYLREQQRVVAVLTQRFHELEAAEREVARGQEFVATLQKQAQAIGKTRAELLELQAAELGVTKAAAPFIAQLKAQEAQLHKSGIEFNQYGLSVKQTQAALRQVPAQLTDIFVSLQGGQNPLTVFLQQGGQLRDVFGGAVPALRAMGAQLLSMVNIWTVAATAVAALGFAWHKADEEQRKLADGLLLTGNRIDLTTEQLVAMSNQLDALSGTSRREASAAMAEILGIGSFTAEQFALVTEAALKMENATGRAIRDTAAEFEKLRKDPVNALIELGTQYGYLDQALLDNAREFERNGQIVEAQTLVMQAHADNIDEITPKIVENMGFIRGMFHDIATGAGDALDKVGEFFTFLDNQMGDEFRQLVSLFGGAPNKQQRPEDPLRSGSITGREGENKEVTAEMAAAQERFRTLESTFDEALRRQREIQKVYADGAAAGYSLIEVEELVMKVQARHAEQDANKAKKGNGQALENAALRSGLQEYKDILAQQQNAIQNDSRILQAEYGARIIDAETYYARQRALTVQDQQAQEAAITGQIAFLRSRDVAGKEAIDVQRQLGELEAKLAQVRDDGTTKLRVLTIEETASAAARKLAIDSYADTLARANETLERQVNAEIAAIGLGSRVAEQQRAIADAYVERDERLRELQDRLARRDIGAAEYNADVAALRNATDEKVRIITDGFRRMDEARSSWQNGMQAGIQNWLDAATDVATQVQQIWERSLDRTADALAEFAETGRLEWRSFLTDILKMLLDFYAKQAVLQFAQMFLSMFSGGTTGSKTYGSASGNFKSSAEAMPLPTIGAKAYSEPAMAAMSSVQAKSSAPVMLSVSTTINNDGTATSETRASGDEALLYREFTERVRAEVAVVIEKESRQGGKLWRAGVQR